MWKQSKPNWWVDKQNVYVQAMEYCFYYNIE